MKSARDATPTSDIWSIGALLYHAISGELPFHASTLSELFTRVLTEPPRPLRMFRPDVPPRLAEVIESCLRHDPRARPQSVVDLAEALRPFASHSQPTATPAAHRPDGLAATALVRPGVLPAAAPAVGAPPAVGVATTHSAAAGQRLDSHRRDRSLFGAAAVVIATAALIYAVWLRSEPAQPSVDRPPDAPIPTTRTPRPAAAPAPAPATKGAIDAAVAPLGPDAGIAPATKDKVDVSSPPSRRHRRPPRKDSDAFDTLQ